MRQLLKSLEQDFLDHSDTDNAIAMAKYMKQIAPFYGIKSDLRNQLAKDFMRRIELPEYNSLNEFVRTFWTKDQREWQYVGMGIPLKYKNEWGFEIIELFEYMIVTKSWWDTVDYIASNLVGMWAKQNEIDFVIVMDKWNNSNNIWLIRTSLIFQLKFKDRTDSELLFKYIDNHKESKEFFIKKAIGWALRQLSKSQPELVKSFLSRTKLQPLSIREASKFI